MSECVAGYYYRSGATDGYYAMELTVVRTVTDNSLFPVNLLSITFAAIRTIRTIHWRYLSGTAV